MNSTSDANLFLCSYAVLQLLIQDPEIRHTFMKGATCTGKVLGEGAFGRVVELKHNGLFYAGKVFRGDIETVRDLREDAGTGRDFRKMFVHEYKILTELSHENIVPYQGICVLETSQLPLLVMDKMESNLHKYLLKLDNQIDLQRKLQILYGIAGGLVYLHLKKIMHRDLTATNVLLDKDGVPRISDFGNSRMIDNSPFSELNTMTECPGTLSYMPPEAMEENAQYNDKIDVFSYGHLSLFVNTRTFPRHLLAVKYRENGERKVRTEVQRRDQYFKLLEADYPFIPLMIRCLNDEIDERPTAVVIRAELQELRRKLPT